MIYIEIVAIIVLVIVIICGYRYKTVKSPYDLEGKQFSDLRVDKERLTAKLQQAIRLKTISHIDQKMIDYKQFDQYLKLLENSFPKVFSECSKHIINQHSIVLHYELDNNKKPILLTSHIDVVPVEEGTENDWSHPAFEGIIADDYLWGRGTLDTKTTGISALEALETILEKGKKPSRSVVIAFGHDEEIGGANGAKAICDYFVEKQISFEFLMDEGGVIGTDVLDGVARPMATIGIAEKGYVDLELKVAGEGGHASTPPKHTALGVMSQVVCNLENKQMPLQLGVTTKLFLEAIAPYMSSVNRLILSNLWLFKPIFLKAFSNTNIGNALLRTTTASTMAKGSDASNVLPQFATATCNFRITPGESTTDLLKHIKDINKGISIDIHKIRMEEPSMVSDLTGEGFNTIATIIKSMTKEAIIVPYVMLAASDSRHYEQVCNKIFRFAPVIVSKKDISTIHNTNEKISLSNIEYCGNFYIQLLMA